MYLVYLFALISYCHIFHFQCLSNCTFNVLYNYITSTCQISKYFHVDHIILNKVKKKTFSDCFLKLCITNGNLWLYKQYFDDGLTFDLSSFTSSSCDDPSTSSFLHCCRRGS